MTGASSPPQKDNPASLLRERGAALRAAPDTAMNDRVWANIRAVAESERIWAAIRGEAVDPLTALKAIRDEVGSRTPGSGRDDEIVRIAEKAIANARDGECPGGSDCPCFQAGYEADRRPA